MTAAFGPPFSFVVEGPELAAGSTDRRNTRIKSFCQHLIFERLMRPLN
jgi:hypothetical protein